MTPARCPGAPHGPAGTDRRTRAAWLAHLDTCDACAGAWDADDPTRMFRVLRDEPVPAAILEAVSEHVSLAIESGRFSDRRRRARAWMANAAAVVLGAALGWTAFRSPGGGTARPATVATAGGAGAVDEHADVRLTSSTEGVQVVDLTVGDRLVVLIFDERMQL